VSVAANPSHAACVDAWLAGVTRDPGLGSVESALDLFEEALSSIWQEAQKTLGEVTLTAIANRVLYVTQDKFPELAGLAVSPEGISVLALRKRLNGLKSTELLEPFRFLLIELLRVLGDLTGDVLTPWLHAELSKVQARPSKPGAVKSTEGEEPPT
jgi:hypothetical protein